MTHTGKPALRRPVLLAALLLATPGLALANADLESKIANPKNWAMQAGDMFNQRYSQLNQINVDNVGKMQVAWMFSTGVLRGHEGSPLVIDGVMYLHSPFPNKVFAIDIVPNKAATLYVRNDSREELTLTGFTLVDCVNVRQPRHAHLPRTWFCTVNTPGV